MSNFSNSEEQLENRYLRSFGRIAGYLPKARAAVDEWQQELSQQISKTVGSPPQSPGVAALGQLIEVDAVVRMYVTEMIDQVDAAHKHIHDVPQLLAALDRIVRTAPRYNRDTAKQNTFPVSTLFTYMMMTPAGEAAFRILLSTRRSGSLLRNGAVFLIVRRAAMF